MTITQVRWSDFGAMDIHLTPGLTSPRLIQLLYVYDDDVNKWLRADKSNVVVSFGVAFRAAFLGAPSSHGVQVNGQTGEVTVAGQLPALGSRLRSFIITATVNEGAHELSTRIRVHLHQGVAARWLSPSSLTVRQAATNMRFAVLARFDDGVIGDITNWSPLDEPAAGDLTFVHHSDATTPMHRWSLDNIPSSTNIFSINQVTGEIKCPGASGAATVSVQIDLGNPLASANVAAAPPWSTPVRVTPVAGVGFAGIDDSGIYNVLFLPDGFTDAAGDRDAFNAYVRKLVTLLRTNSHTRPFDLLSSKFNYFAAWVPSPQAGSSPLSEHFQTSTADGHTLGTDVELPRPASGDLTLESLIDAVGLPTLVFEPPGKPAADKVVDWHLLYDFTPPPGLTDPTTAAGKIYKKWLRRDTRVLINERDTAFHVAYDFRPRVDKANETGTHVHFNLLRLTTDDFNTFLKALQDDKGTPLPLIWPTSGKDDALIVILCRTNRDGGTNVVRSEEPDSTARYLAVALGDLDTNTYTANTDGDGYDLVPDQVPDDVALDGWATVAHELAHSFMLDDEYGGGGKYPATPTADLQIAKRANTQPQDELTDGRHLGAAGIKWRWSRIRVAGVLHDPHLATLAVRPNPADSSQLLVSLTDGHGKGFKTGDTVRLRRSNLLGNSRLSDPLTVFAKDGDELTLSAIEGTDPIRIVSVGYHSGDVLLSPVAIDDDGNDIELVHQMVVNRINDSHNPLNAKPDDPFDRPTPPGEQALPVAASNFRVGERPRNPRLSWQIVGLYEGGAGYDSGIYHPTGLCIMNRTTLVRGSRKRISAFCPVCRYAMVDMVDPTQHGRIDADYDARYPEA